MGWLRRVLGAIPAAEMRGISLKSPGWVLSDVTPDVPRFVTALTGLVPEGSMLFLEGRAFAQSVLQFLEGEHVEVASRPALGTLWPRHRYFSIPATPEVLSGLAQVAAGLSLPEVFDHIHVFRGEEVLISGYDAFASEFWLSASLAEAKVTAFSDVVGGQCIPQDAARAG